MIPFFLPVWRSALLREAILGILLAAAALRAVDLGDNTKPDAGVSRSYDRPVSAAKDAARPNPLLADLSAPKGK